MKDIWKKKTWKGYDKELGMWMLRCQDCPLLRLLRKMKGYLK